MLEAGRELPNNIIESPIRQATHGVLHWRDRQIQSWEPHHITAYKARNNFAQPIRLYQLRPATENLQVIPPTSVQPLRNTRDDVEREENESIAIGGTNCGKPLFDPKSIGVSSAWLVWRGAGEIFLQGGLNTVATNSHNCAFVIKLHQTNSYMLTMSQESQGEWILQVPKELSPVSLTKMAERGEQKDCSL